MVGNTHVLPDSRLKDLSYGVQIANFYGWRVEMIPVFCANCGKPYGWVPKDNCTFACWMCQPCVDEHGLIAYTYAVPEDEFNKAVEHEMNAKFGRALDPLEIWQLEQQGQLGTALEKLAKESPYPVPSA